MQLNYKEFGEGQALVILHGLLGSLDNWQTVARKLSANYKVYTLDLRNHGKSPHSEEHSYEAMAEDLYEFFKMHQLSNVILMGHSMGGKVAMRFALDHPKLLKQLVVVDIAPGSYEAKHTTIFNALRGMNLREIGSREEADDYLSKNILEFGVRQFLLKNLDRTSEGGFEWKMNLEGLWKNYNWINVPIENETAVEMNTVVIRGGKSTYVKDEDEAAFRKLFTKVKLVTVPGAGHWVHAEAPAEFLEALQSSFP